MDSHKAARRKPRSIRQASLRSSALAGVFWWLFIWSGANVGFRWLESEGLVDRRYTFWMTVWSGFFIAFVATLSTRLQMRRKLLVGRVEPDEQEWAWLNQSRARSLSLSIWPAALLSGIFLAGLSGAIQWGLSYLGDGGGYQRFQHVFYAGWLPAIFLPFIIYHHARHSLRRFVSAMENPGQVLHLERRRYLWLHNVLPYALFNASAGTVVAFSRFVPNYIHERAIHAHAISLHLALTAMVISLFVVTAARFKTRVDFLSPVRLSAKSRNPGRDWRLLYALVAPLLTYGILRLVLWILGKEELEPMEALGLKLIVCLSFSLLTAHWAVNSTLLKMEHSGLDEHPYVRFHRFLRSTGFIDPFRRKRLDDQ